ncbi:MAG: metallophosphoesterase, partial [Candidatus Bipolaricaulia bacterium]
MHIGFMHLSDLHMPPPSGGQYRFERTISALLATLKKRATGLHVDMIFITGDLVDKCQDYSAVGPFLDALLEHTGIGARVENPRERVFVVPGNHDIERECGAYLKRTLESSDEADAFFDPAHRSPRELYFAKFARYAEFYNQYFGKKRQFTRDDYTLCDGITIADVGERCTVGVLGMNSAWFCQDDSDHSRLWIGERVCDVAVAALAGRSPDFVFALHHHPYSWLARGDSQAVKRLVEDVADFDLSGHLHDGETEMVVGESGIVRLRAGALYEGASAPKLLTTGILDTRNRSVVIEPLKFNERSKRSWVIDTELFPDSPDYRRAFELRHPKPVDSSTSEARAYADVSRYLARLRRRLANGPRGSLIDLGLATRTSSAGWKRLAPRRKPQELLSIEAVARQYQGDVVVLIGEPGAGKTTLLRELALGEAKKGRRIPCIVNLGLYAPGGSLIDLMDLRERTPSEVNAMLDTGALLVLLDAVNEAPWDSIDEVLRDLIAF